MATRKKSKSASRPAKKPVKRAAPKKAPMKAAEKPKRRAVPARKAPKPAPLAAGAATAMGMNAPNGQPVRTGIGILHHHMDYSTHDQEAMRRFFVETLGFTNVVHIPEHQYFTVFVTPTSSLGFMPPMGTAPEQWQPPGEPSFY